MIFSMELYPLAIQAIIYLAITSNFINALKIAKKSFVEPEKNTFGKVLFLMDFHSFKIYNKLFFDIREEIEE